MKGLALARVGWRRQLAMASAMMAVVPLLTLGYLVTAYIQPNVITLESLALVVLLNVVLGLCGYMVLWKTLNAVNEFRRHIEDIADGNLESRLSVKNGPEVTGIVNALEQIVDQLKQDRDRLQTHSQELEVLVSDRTQELRNVNEQLMNQLSQTQEAETALRKSNQELSDALAEIKDMQMRLIQQERLSALGQMASGIAHDFNNALMPVLGLSEVLVRSPETIDNKQEVREIATDIHQAAQDARQIVRRLREFYKAEDHMEHEAVDIQEVVQSALALTQPRWKEELGARGVIIHVEEHYDDVPLTTGNGPELREAVTNLILNAVDAMPEGGTLTMRVSKGDGHIAVTVKDTGVGMNDEVKRRCLEPFFTTKRGTGSGLGLSMVFGIVRRHKGKIDIESEEGKGTSVILRLPLSEEGIRRPQAEVSGTPSRPLSILLVEDDPRSEGVVVRYLRAEGHSVVVARTGGKGIEEADKTEFDLVITDRALPDMSGDKVASTISTGHPKMHVVMLTGFGDAMRRQGEKPAGVDLVVGKPVTFKEISDVIASVCGVRK